MLSNKDRTGVYGTPVFICFLEIGFRSLNLIYLTCFFLSRIPFKYFAYSMTQEPLQYNDNTYIR